MRLHSNLNKHSHDWAGRRSQDCTILNQQEFKKHIHEVPGVLTT